MKAGLEVGFVLIGGQHQLLHLLPVAAALSRHEGVQVHLFAPDERTLGAAMDLFRRLHGGPVAQTVLRLPRLAEMLDRGGRGAWLLKEPRLIFWFRRLRQCNALVAVERTSTRLKSLPGRCPTLIHIPHGAGDRARGFEPRITRFDHVIVAGDKDRRRMVATGLVAPDRCHVSGYIKHAALRDLHPEPAARLFTNDRPIVLYNPHFDRHLSSWHDYAAPLVRAICASNRYNLIVAPHVRLFETATANQRQQWAALALPDRVIVDLGSAASSDMTYTRAADIYLGDVSSQVYEFAARPRPCIFLNTHQANWRGNADYLMWELGEVVDALHQILPALDRAVQDPQRFRAVQERLVTDALGDVAADCAGRAADIILSCLR
jgi:hypothetical protein